MCKRTLAHLKALIESTEDQIWSVDPGHRLILFNQTFQQKIEKNFGVQVTIGMRPEDYLPPETADRWNSFFQRVLSRGPFQTEYLSTDDRVLNISFNLIIVESKTIGVSIFGKDITAARSAEESRRFLASVVESCEEAIYAFDLEGAILTWNRGAQRIFGYSVAEVIGRPVALLIAEPYRDSLKQAADELVRDGVSTERRVLGLRKDGRTVQLSFTAWPVKGRRGQATAISVIARDISREKQAEQVQALLASIVESSEDAIHAVKLDGTVLSWNQSAEQLTGYGCHEMIGKNISMLAGPERAEEVRGCLEAIARGMTIRPFDSAITHKNGLKKDVSISISPIFNARREVVGAAGILRDASERKRMEGALRETEKNYREIFDGALEGMFRAAPDGKLLAANPALASILGYKSPDEMTAASGELALGVWAAETDRLLFTSRLMEERVVRGFECPFRRKDGQVVWVSLNCQRICSAEGLTLYYQGFIEDITERRKTQESLRLSGDLLEEAQRVGGLGCYSVNLVKGTFTGSSLFCELLGVEAEQEYPIEAWKALIHPEDYAVAAEYLRPKLPGQGRRFEIEHRIVRQRDGAVRWVQMIGTIDSDERGNPASMRGIVKDITDRKEAELELRNSEERYRTTFEQAAVGIVHCAFDGSILRSNSRFAEIVGYAREEVCGLTIPQITASEDIAENMEVLRRILRQELSSAALEKRYVRKDGTRTWVRLTISCQCDGTGRRLHYIAIVEDINARKAAEAQLTATAEALRVSELHYRNAFQTSIDAISISRMEDGTYVDVNETFLRTFGYERAELLGRTALELGIWADLHDRSNFIEILRQNPSCRDVEARFRKKNGELFWVLISASKFVLDGIPSVLLVVRDLSEAKEAENEIRNLAFYDPLTRLPNRRLMLDRLEEILVAGNHGTRKHALLLIGLDNFKTLNETLGHKSGDILLKETARRLAGYLQRPNSAARVGGDEFAVLLENLSEVPEHAAEQAKTVAERVLAGLREAYLLDGHDWRGTASIGITVFGNGQNDANEILRQADIAIHQAKQSGGDEIRFFAPALQAVVNARARMESDLRNATKLGQFVLYFQPQVRNAQLIGTEALIRWAHPERGIVSPYEFIFLAEETGLIVPMGSWVLNSACDLIAAWERTRGVAGVTVAVNISVRQFRENDFVDRVIQVLERTGANPRRLKLELTESVLAENVDAIAAKMTRLKSLGVGFALDDFGTGYSSLCYLKRLPLDQLKIDRSFVQDILTDATSGAIAQTIISLGRAMGLPVIAEGVETAEQRDLLSSMGCDMFQGYFFGRPMPLEEFEQTWLPRLDSREEPSLPALDIVRECGDLHS